MGNSTDKIEKKIQPGKNAIGNKQGYPEFLTRLGQILEKKSLDEEGKTGITKTIFKRYLCKASETAAVALFEYFLIKEGILTYDDSKEAIFGDISDNKVLSKESFLKQSTILLNCSNETQQLDYFIKVFAKDKEAMVYANFSKLIGASYEIAQFAHRSPVLPDDLLSALSKAVMRGKDEASCKYILDWCCENCPRLVTWLHRYLSHTLRLGYSTIPNNEEIEEDDNETPILDSATKSSCASLHPSLLWMLSCSLPPSYTKESSPPDSPSNAESKTQSFRQFPDHLISGQTPSHWTSLFNSNEHGTSVNRFKHHVFDYHGPTLLFVTTDDNSMFCVACDRDWKDSREFFGGYDSMCLQLLPEYKIIEQGPNLLNLNIGIKSLPMGFQIGTNARSRALTIDINLENVEHRRIPSKLISLEVWGCGSAKAKEKQLETKVQATRDAEKVSKVKMDGKEWNDHPDRMLLDMAGSRPTYAKFEKETQNQT